MINPNVIAAGSILQLLENVKSFPLKSSKDDLFLYRSTCAHFILIATWYLLTALYPECDIQNPKDVSFSKSIKTYTKDEENREKINFYSKYLDYPNMDEFLNVCAYIEKYDRYALSKGTKVLEKDFDKIADLLSKLSNKVEELTHRNV